MKLTKVSLAALVALGAFSSVASATPLEEAIKNVDISGYARYRYTNTQTKKQTKEATETKTNKETKADHAFKSLINFKAAFDDRFFGVLGLKYESKDNSGSNGYDNANATGVRDNTDTGSTFAVSQIYLGYKAGNTTLTAGRQKLGTFFSDEEIGTGVRLVNSDIPGLTLAAVAFDAIEKGDPDGKPNNLLDAAANKKYDKLGNLYGVATIGSYDPVSFQLWYASLANVADLFAVEVAGDVALSDDVSFNLKGQFVNNDADKKLKDTKLYGDGHFYAVEAGTSLFGLDFTAGYIGWKVKPLVTVAQDGAKTHTDIRSSFSFEDQGGLIDIGDSNYDYTWMTGKGSQFFVAAAYKFDKFGVGAEYRNGKTTFANKDLSKEKQEEYVLRANYAYSKKLKFSSFYSATTINNVAGDKTKKDTKDKFRFEAKYSF